MTQATLDNINTLSYSSINISSLQNVIDDWNAHNKITALWNKDSQLWTNNNEQQWLAWLDVIDTQYQNIASLQDFATQIKAEFSHIVLLGMGGSSMCPEVLFETYGAAIGYPQLQILDSTDPGHILQLESSLDLSKTLFIVASKSGGTLEPNTFKQYFYQRMLEIVGEQQVGQHFVVITDPGSQMEKIAKQQHFRHIFYGDPEIGGRYSALSAFGLVSVALLGMDLSHFLQQAKTMQQACRNTEVENNPGVLLGLLLGTLAEQGKDKLTFITSPAIYDFGAWLEQLVAESTGKQGKAIIPVDLEPIVNINCYSPDRVFVYLALEKEEDTQQQTFIQALEAQNFTVIHIQIAHKYALAQEFFRWEIATAVACSVMHINAFDQPDVEASKIVTRELTSAYEHTGQLPGETPFIENNHIALYSDTTNITALEQILKDKQQDASITAYLQAHFSRVQKRDYIALVAYITRNAKTQQSLQSLRQQLLEQYHCATCLAFGPRFLHSTGQAYKGGANNGVFLQFTIDDPQKLPVPGQQYTFSVVKNAQARGDFTVLAKKQRRVLRVHIKTTLDLALHDLLQFTL